MRDKAVDDSLAALKLVPYWFVTSKIIKKLYTTSYTDDGLRFFVEDFGDVTFCCNEMDVLSVNLNNCNLDNNFHTDYSDTIILMKFLAWHSKLKKRQALKKR